jgi:hypothetical protein
MKFLACLLVFAQVFQYGRAGSPHVPDANPQHASEFDFPVGVVYSQYEAVVDMDHAAAGNIQGAFIGAVRGAGGSFGLCATAFSIASTCTLVLLHHRYI